MRTVDPEVVGSSPVEFGLSTITGKRGIPDMPENLAWLLPAFQRGGARERWAGRRKRASQKPRTSPERPDHTRPTAQLPGRRQPRPCPRAASSRSRFPRFYMSRNIFSRSCRGVATLDSSASPKRRLMASPSWSLYLLVSRLSSGSSHRSEGKPPDLEKKVLGDCLAYTLRGDLGNHCRRLHHRPASPGAGFSWPGRPPPPG